MVWCVSSMATAVSQWTSFVRLALGESCPELLTRHIKSYVLHRGRLERRTNAGETTEQNESRALAPLPPTLTSTYQSCIVNFKYGLVKTKNFYINLMFYIVLKLGEKKEMEEKNILKLNSDCSTNSTRQV